MKRIFENNSYGRGKLLFKWQPKYSTFLAVVGSNLSVHIYDKHSDQIDNFLLSAQCINLEWSPDGETLALIQEKSSLLLLWDANSKKISLQLDTNMKSLRLLKWSENGDKLSIGTAKGNLFILDRRSGKKIPVMGKHTKSIVCGAWNSDDCFACASDDQTFSISNTAGDTLFQMPIKGDPSQMQWNKNTNKDNKSESLLSIVLNERSLFFYNTNDSNSPTELSFQTKYGNIVNYEWFGESSIIIGFSLGYLIVISTKKNEIGQEIFQSRDHKDVLTDVSISLALNKVATCGDTCIKIHDLSDMQDVWAIINLDDERCKLDEIGWSEDGQFLTISTKEGSIFTYLMKLPMIYANFDSNVIFLSSLKEMTISDQALVDQKISSIVATSPDLIKRSVEIEPTIVGLGPTHFVIGLDNNAWFYSIRGPKKDKPLVKRQSAVSRLLPSTSDFNSLAFKKSFVANIVSISLNAQFSSVLLADGKLYLNSIEEQEQNTIEKSKQFQKVFPEKDILLKIKPGKDFKVTCVELTNEFLIYGTSNGLIHHYVLKEWVLVNEIKHKYGIRNLAVNEKGVKFTFIDDKNEAYLCNPASNTMLRIVGGLPNSSGMIWNKIINSPAQNQSHRNIFVSWNNNSINTFSYQPFTTRGAECVLLGATRLPHGMIPITAINGVLTCLTASGKLSLVPLISNEEIKESNRTGTMLYVPKLSSEVETKNEIEQGRILQLYYSLGQMKEIWNLIPIIKTTKPWLTLVEQALHVLDILTAKRIYRQILGNVGMVLTLEDLEWIDDRNLIAGHVSSILGNISLAQDFFLKSSNPIAILELRRDLMHWEQALNLAQTLAPQEVTIIAKEYAHQLEFDAKYSEAFAMYEKALSTSSTHTGHEDQLIDHQIACSGGLTRMTCRMGDIARGMKMLNGCTDKQLLSECGSILESLKQYPESGSLFERAEKWERAAESYIKAKNWTKVGSLIPLINNSKIIVQYGKNREAEKLYQDAALAYEKGRDYFSLVRIYVDHLKNIDAAVAIVRKTQCRKSAKLVSKFFQSIKDYKSVIEFYVMAGIIDEAFEIATQNDVVEHFAEIIKDETSTEMLLNISNYFENKKQFFLAGKYLLQCGQYSKALHMLLQCPTENSAAIDLAIETVGLANNDGLTHELIDFLMGERDGVAKEAKYIFRLHMSLKQYKEAARTAIIIAREEQMLGNYRAAHDLLLDNYCQLRNMKAKVPSELAKMLMLLHSYILVKVLIRLDDHEKGAQMLIRVSNSISKFPSHIVPILTSTVIECQRAGLKRHALDFAAMLMRPEYRNKVDAKYKKKIEQIVRRPDKDQVVESENKSPCPFCNSNIPDSLLDCPECKNQLPYCIATGRHMLFDDWTQCPHCEFPALYSHLKVVVQKNQQCPMCSKSLKLEQLVFVKDPTEHLRGKKEEKDLEEKGLEETGGFVKNTGNLEVKVMKGISKQNDIGGNSGIQIAPAATANMNCATYINV